MGYGPSSAGGFVFFGPRPASSIVPGKWIFPDNSRAYDSALVPAISHRHSPAREMDWSGTAATDNARDAANAEHDAVRTRLQFFIQFLLGPALADRLRWLAIAFENLSWRLDQAMGRVPSTVHQTPCLKCLLCGAIEYQKLVKGRFRAEGAQASQQRMSEAPERS